jgi:hypothetical protein
MSQGTYGAATTPVTGRESTSFGTGTTPSHLGSAHSSQEPQSLKDHLLQFCNENPTTVAAWCFGIGFALGWRLKPW